MATLTYLDALEEFIPQNRPGWGDLTFFKNSAQTIAKRLDEDRAQGVQITPNPSDFLKAFSLTPLSTTRALILGQDPYPTPDDAHGLCFSTPKGRPLPKSLQTIFKAYHHDLGYPIPKSGDLTPWAHAGLLLLNRSLTTQEKHRQAHASYGWDALIFEVFSLLNAQKDPILFFLWGKKAQQMDSLVTNRIHIRLSAPHPSPLGRGKTPKGQPHPFLTHHPFLSANQALENAGFPKLAWMLP